ncbi:hypothetical protein [Rossellomorea aquimaris]|nr:hypothetical protein [Rossellomorea aquimaris]
MKSITVHHYDAFSQKLNKGNPADIVLSRDNGSWGQVPWSAL